MKRETMHLNYALELEERARPCAVCDGTSAHAPSCGGDTDFHPSTRTAYRRLRWYTCATCGDQVQTKSLDPLPARMGCNGCWTDDMCRTLWRRDIAARSVLQGALGHGQQALGSRGDGRW